MWFISFCLGFICCWLLGTIEDHGDGEARALQTAIVASFEGYLRNKPLLTQQELDLLKKITALHDLD